MGSGSKTSAASSKSGYNILGIHACGTWPLRPYIGGSTENRFSSKQTFIRARTAIAFIHRKCFAYYVRIRHASCSWTSPRNWWQIDSRAEHTTDTVRKHRHIIYAYIRMLYTRVHVYSEVCYTRIVLALGQKYFFGKTRSGKDSRNVGFHADG